MTPSEFALPPAPWLTSYDPGVPAQLPPDKRSLFQALAHTAARHGSQIAWDYMGRHCTYRQFLAQVERCAVALAALGVRPGERVLLCLPNCPQALALFYAVNRMGGVCVMAHPLSARGEIDFFLRDSQAVAAFTLTQCGENFAVRGSIPLVLTTPADALVPPLRTAYALKEGRCPSSALSWQGFLRLGRGREAPPPAVRREEAVILYSGGTTGTTKGILLTDQNFNALAAQILATNPSFRPGDKMLAVMPLFHGFGLGVSIHAILYGGGRCVLSPRFSPASYIRLLQKHRPAFIAGVPTLYEALLRQGKPEKLDFSQLKGAFSGGDSLSVGLKERFDAFLAAHGARVQLREGYGTTECVTASCLAPVEKNRAGSIGLPFPDMRYKIVRPGTEEVLPTGEEGEICIAGPTVMLGYLNQPEETAATLRTHGDGLRWVHTGDLGHMDEEGFFYFHQRLKRMIVTSGYNVYPSRIEEVLEGHPAVQLSCVIGVANDLRGQRVKAFVTLRPGQLPDEDCRRDILRHCHAHIAHYALPRELEFREELPKTLVGKVAYRQLEEEEARRR